MLRTLLLLFFFSISYGAAGAVLVENGRPCAAIILDPTASKPAQLGALELQHHIQKMTGALLPIVKTVPNNFKTRIFLGESEFTRREGLKNTDFKNQEYLVKIQGNDIFLLGRDYDDRKPVVYSSPATYPDFWSEIGTCYAVYDFLELLGFRWYLPTDLGITFMPSKNLTVENITIRRRPTMEYRDQFYLPIPASLAGDTIETADREPLNQKDTKLWYFRNRHGGKRIAINHSFYTWYQRFYPAKKDWFAQGYSGRPPQLCYSNPEVLRQVIQDARDFFDGKAEANQLISNVQRGFQSDCFPVFPMDNRSWCKCAACQSQLPAEATQGNGQFSNDRASNYIFRFINAVAKEIKKTHPDKFIGAGTYAEFCYPPTGVRLEENVKIMLCLHNRMIYAKDIQENDGKILDAWQKAFPELKKNVWMYYCFPSLTARQRQLRLFPGFFANHVKNYFRDYLKRNVIGMFWEPSYLPYGQHSVLFDQLEGHINWQLAWNKDLDPDLLFREFFLRYYGPAAEPMRQFYLRVESIFTNPANYPPHTKHQTEDIAWNRLGTAPRMKELGSWMNQAKKLAQEEPFRSRVALFEKGIWQYMQKGRKRASELAGLMAPTMQQTSVPRLKYPVSGDPAAVPWDEAAQLNLYGGLRAEPLKRRLNIRTAHDGTWIYFRYSEFGTAPEKLATDRLVWLNDEWESFFARQRSASYRQIAIDSKGQCAGMNHDGTVTDSWAFPGKIVIDKKKDSWSVLFAVRLSEIVRGGITPGEILYYNVIRSEKTLPRGCWIPTFSGFHAPERFGELYLMPQ